jgi:hypothetical protein
MVLILYLSDLPSPVLAELLERLESTYYQEVLSKFTADDYTAAGFARSSIPIQELTAIAFDEKTHDNLLEVSISFSDSRSHSL